MSINQENLNREEGQKIDPKNPNLDFKKDDTSLKKEGEENKDHKDHSKRTDERDGKDSKSRKKKKKFKKKEEEEGGAGGNGEKYRSEQAQSKDDATSFYTLKLGQSDVNYQGFKTDNPLVESLAEHIKLKYPMADIATAPNLGEKDDYISFMQVLSEYGKRVSIKMPNLPTDTRVFTESDFVNELRDNYLELNARYKYEPDIVHLGFTLNISGENCNSRVTYKPTFDALNQMWKVDSTGYAGKNMSYLSVSNTSSGSAIRQDQDLTLSEATVPFVTSSDIDKTLLSDIGSFNKKASYSAVLDNINKHYIDHPSKRYFELASDVELIRALTDSAIQASTFLYLAIDSLKEVLEHRGIITAAHGIVDGVQRILRGKSRSNQRYLMGFTNAVNKLFSFIPVNKDVIDVWNQYKSLSKLNSDPVDSVGNPLINSVFVLMFNTSMASSKEEALDVQLNDTIARSSLRFVHYNWLNEILNMFKPRKALVGNTDEVLASISAGVSTQYMEDIFEAMFIEENIDKLNLYLNKSLGLWAHLKEIKAFDSTRFEYTSVTNEWWKLPLKVDVPVSSEIKLYRDFNHKYNFLPIAVKKQLLDFRGLMYKISSPSYDESFLLQRWFKFLYISGTDSFEPSWGKEKSIFTKKDDIVYFKGRALLGIQPFNSIIFPMILSDVDKVSGTYPISFRGIPYAFTGGKNQTVDYLPMSSAVASAKAGQWSEVKPLIQTYDDSELSNVYIDKSANGSFSFCKGYHPEINFNASTFGLGREVTYYISDDRARLPFAPTGYDWNSEVGVKYLTAKDIINEEQSENKKSNSSLNLNPIK